MEYKFDLRHFIQDALFIIAGVAFSAFALKSFLIPFNPLDGGIMGISLLIHDILLIHNITSINLAYIVVTANIPLILLGAYWINGRFAIKTLACVILLAIALTVIPYHPIIALPPQPIEPGYKLFASIFGGFFMGLGIGLVMRGGAALDGFEVLAVLTWRRSSFTVFDIMLAINVILFLIAAVELGLLTSLYAVLTYFIATRTVEYVVEGLEEYTGVTIISGKSEEIKRRLVMELGRAITIYKGERGFMKESFEVHHECDIIFTVITRLEVRRLKNMVEQVDRNAFVFTNSIKETAGGILKKHHTHEHK